MARSIVNSTGLSAGNLHSLRPSVVGSLFRLCRQLILRQALAAQRRILNFSKRPIKSSKVSGRKVSRDTAPSLAPQVSERLHTGKSTSLPPVAVLASVPAPIFRRAASDWSAPRAFSPCICVSASTFLQNTLSGMVTLALVSSGCSGLPLREFSACGRFHRCSSVAHSPLSPSSSVRSVPGRNGRVAWSGRSPRS